MILLPIILVLSITALIISFLRYLDKFFDNVALRQFEEYKQEVNANPTGETHGMVVKKLQSEAIIPTRAHSTDAGADLYSLDNYTAAPGEGVKVSTGIAADIGSSYYLHIHTRSSMAKEGWVVLGGVIDNSYKGELFVMLRNLSNKVLSIAKGDRIAQGILHKLYIPNIVEVEDIGTSTRGTGGFGSSGK